MRNPTPSTFLSAALRIVKGAGLSTSILFSTLGEASTHDQSSAAPGGSIAGVVTVPPLTGRSIAGVFVTLEETGQMTEVTGDGRHQFTAVPAGTYTLLATGDGFSRLRIPIRLPRAKNYFKQFKRGPIL